MRELDVRAQDFDLRMTLNSGQVFHWEKVGAGFCGAIGDRAAYVEQRGNSLRAKVEDGVLRSRRNKGPGRMAGSLTAATAAQLVQNYFALDHRLGEICESFPSDPLMNSAREFCSGLRIIRQPKWECLATFICSSMKQVAHIRQISRGLRQRFGEKKQIDEHEVFSFPSAARLARKSETELLQCGLGYRAKNLLATAKRIDSGEADLNSWSTLSDGELRERLCQLPGVGIKIANCAMLFAYERIAAFPIDVWIERVLRQNYLARRRTVTGQIMAEFAADHFGRYGGYAQQYLFHHARMTRKRGDNK
ncbi:MAG TPA: DNA glycosylase [Chthoniobacterales bacterium]|jgi:N-glycosylase/DNA lyase